MKIKLPAPIKATNPYKVVPGAKLIAIASATDYLMSDGLANVDKIQTVGDRAKKLIGKEGVEVDGFYMIPRRAKPVKHSAAKEKSKDVKYLTKRALKVIYRKRLSEDSVTKIKYQVLLPLVYGPGVSKDLISKINDCHKALERHQNKAVTVKEKVSKQKSEVRVEVDKTFTQSLAILNDILEASGVPAGNVATVTGMFGKAVLIKLDAENVIQVGPADMSKFRAAKKAMMDAAAS